MPDNLKFSFLKNTIPKLSKIRIRLNSFFPGYKISSLLFSFLLIFPVLVFSADIKTYTLTGRVVNEAGSPLNNIEILLYPESGSVPELNAGSLKTGSDGIFEFRVPEGQSYIMELKGDRGSGRLHVPSPGNVILNNKVSGITYSHGSRNLDISGKLEITYPVKETIVILHTNDHHFSISNLEELTTAITEIRSKYENVFLLSAGDIFVRHPMRWVLNGTLMRNPEWFGERSMLMVTTMNDLGYDAMTLGNHELDYREPYSRLALEASQFPLLAANYDITTDKLPVVEDYVIFKTSTARKIAVLGLTTGGGKDGVKERGLNSTVKQHIFLRDSAEVFVALTHIGLKRDYVLAGDFPQFDVIVGGHSHDLLETAVLSNSVLIAHAGGNPHFASDQYPVYLGKIVLTLENGIITEKKGWVIKILQEVFEEVEEYEEVEGY
jgi:hypothetical protein